MGLAFYTSVVVLLISTVGATLCFAYHGTFRHRSAFWLSMCMVGVSFFALAGMLFELSKLAGSDAAFVEPVGLRLLWQAIGAVFIVHALPRFLLAAFGAPRRPLRSGLLDAATVAVALLSGIRVATGWETMAAIPQLPNALLRVCLYLEIGAAFLATLIFQSRLPDRNLYRTVVVQIGTFALLIPFVIMEDLGVFTIPGFPYLSGQVLLVTSSVFASLHARTSLKRPKYVENKAPSAYFAEHFRVSGRELEVVEGVMLGLSNNQLAEKLYISPRTVEKHLYNIYQKTGIRSRLQLFNLMRSDAG